ncbi:MAG: 50S ribosomal protein L3 N(5)-glutamine methyltransferase [Candidatus Symbiodolus clandestinus]
MDPQQLEEAIEQLPTLLDLFRWATSQFNGTDLCYGHGNDSAWDEAKHILLSGLQLPIDWPTDCYQARLTLDERRQLVTWINQRIEQKIPAAYLTQRAWFCGLEFYVDQRVLIPRSPFSELINNRFADTLEGEPQHLLELCTGSGCIAIACAYAFPEAEIDIVDVSADALAVAEINIQGHGLEQQITPVLSDLFQQLPAQQYDLIIANPPYVDAEDMANLPAEFHHEPVLGLAAGPDGLALVEPILKTSARYLSEQGQLFCEVGNSFLALQARYPDLPVQWLPLSSGSPSIFRINRQQLEVYFGP